MALRIGNTPPPSPVVALLYPSQLFGAFLCDVLYLWVAKAGALRPEYVKHVKIFSAAFAGFKSLSHIVY